MAEGQNDIPVAAGKGRRSYVRGALAVRFAARVVHAEGDACWLWRGARQKPGYGRVNLGGGKIEHAHRVAWRLANRRRIPAGRAVLHKCDNPPCVRPDHLFLGTDKMNVADKELKGRGRNPQLTLATLDSLPSLHCRHRKVCQACKNRRRRIMYQVRRAIQAGVFPLPQVQVVDGRGK